MAQHQAEVDACVAHLTDHSEHYFNVVRGKRQDGVLWAVFAAVRPRTDVPLNANKLPKLVGVKRASFLPLTTVLNTNAPSLIQMFNTCDHTRQFVCWFTLESSDGEPLLSKVMCVDGDAQHHPREDRHQYASPNPPQQQGRGFGDTSRAASMRRAHSNASAVSAAPAANGSSRAATNAGPASPTADIEALKTDMDRFERLHRGGSATPRGGGASRHASPPQTRAGRAGSPLVTGSVVGQQSYQQILRMSMQVADSVAEMGQGLEEVRSDIGDLRRAFESAPRPPPADAWQQVLSRLDAIEHRQLEMEQRVSSFDDVQKRFYEQVTQIREQLATAGPGPANGEGEVSERLAEARAREQAIRAKLDKPISYKGLVEERARAEAAATAGTSVARQPGRQSPSPADISSRLTVEPPHLESEGSSSDDDAHANTASTPGAGSAKPGSSRATSVSAQPAATATPATRTPPVPSSRSSSPAVGGGSYGQARTAHHSDPSPASSQPRQQQPTGQGGGGGDESLTDMIKSMERKLSRISLPAGGRK